jgi:alpha-tubulin suppressor-like RCC1 family protein
LTEIFAGKTFSFFKNCEKEVYGCGSNHFNQLGLPAHLTAPDGTKKDQTEIPLPVKIDAFDLYTLSQLVSGPNHSLAMCSLNGRSVALSWGCQRHAQLGLPIVSQSSTLPQIVHFFNDVTLSSVGDS